MEYAGQPGKCAVDKSLTALMPGYFTKCIHMEHPAGYPGVYSLRGNRVSKGVQTVRATLWGRKATTEIPKVLSNGFQEVQMLGAAELIGRRIVLPVNCHA
jgi:hypothetical protein